MLGLTNFDSDVRRAVASDSAAIARVHVDSWRTAYKGIIDENYLASLSYVDREAMWSQAIGNAGNIVLVAEDTPINVPAKTVVGFVSGGTNRAKDTSYAGELYAIYILEEYRGKGIGKKLVRSLVQRLADLNIDSMLVWVLAKNPYRQFYERLGGLFVTSQEIQIGGANFEEIAYGWKDLNPLMNTQ